MKCTNNLLTPEVETEVVALTLFEKEAGPDTQTHLAETGQLRTQKKQCYL